MATSVRSAGDPLPPTCELIEVHVAELKQLFNAIDPSPFRERDLDPNAEEFIVDWAKEASPSATFGLAISNAIGLRPVRSHSVGRLPLVLSPRSGKPRAKIPPARPGNNVSKRKSRPELEASYVMSGRAPWKARGGVIVKVITRGTFVSRMSSRSRGRGIGCPEPTDVPTLA